MSIESRGSGERDEEQKRHRREESQKRKSGRENWAHALSFVWYYVDPHSKGPLGSLYLLEMRIGKESAGSFSEGHRGRSRSNLDCVPDEILSGRCSRTFLTFIGTLWKQPRTAARGWPPPNGVGAQGAQHLC